jgi:addiction module HigA family antidote
MDNSINPEAPGKLLERKYLIPHRLSQNKLARDLDVPTMRISEIVRNRRGISADTALRLARYFDTTPRYWLDLQTEYDLYQAKQRSEAAIKVTVRKNPLL